MIWFEAALAFALTMLIFATMVSVIVEAGMRIFLARESGFQRMLEQLFDEMIKPRITDLLTHTSIDTRSNFIEKLGFNPLTSKTGGLTGLVSKLLVPRRNTSMTVMQFAERLADTQVGQEIAKQTEDRMDILVKDMAQKFESVGAAATETYTRRAATISMLTAMVFAFAANVDSVRLLKTFVSNQQLTSNIIARSEEIQDNHQKQQKAMEDLLDDIESASAGGRDAEQSADLKELRETAAQLENDLADLASQGLPVTYEFFPACPVGGSDMRCDAYHEYLEKNTCVKSSSTNLYGRKHRLLSECLAANHDWWDPILHDLATSFGWFLSVLLSGLLIGLGGPFWYNLVSSLTRVLQLARSMGMGQKPKQPESAGTPAPVVQSTDQPHNPLEAFKTAAQAIGVSASVSGRVPLSPSGEPLMEDGR